MTLRMKPGEMPIIGKYGTDTNPLPDTASIISVMPPSLVLNLFRL